MIRYTLWLTFGMLASGLALSQEQNPPDTNTYESFLRQVAQQKNVAGPVVLNGQSTNLTRPSVQDTLGFLTAEEVQALSTIAGDLADKAAPLENAVKHMVFEERLAAIASETASPSVSSRLEELNRRRTQTVVDPVEQLRALLGESRFRMVESFINSRKDSGSFFPLVPAGVSRPRTVRPAAAR